MQKTVFNEREELDVRNAHQHHAENLGFVNEWDENDEDYDEDLIGDGLDPAFSSWEQANGMFFSMN